MKLFLFKCLYYFLRLFIRIKKRIFIYSDNYYDSPRFIVEKMHELYPGYDVVFMPFDNIHVQNGFVPDYVLVKRHSWFSFCTLLLSSFCVINNFEFTSIFIKRKKQLFIQTYHGDRGPKKILFDCDSSVECLDNKVTDLMIVGSKFGAERALSAFRYTGKILQIGMPRNDQLIIPDNNKALEIRKRLNIPDNKKVLLYAPTFRNVPTDYSKNIDLKRINQLLNEEYVILVRMHRADKQKDLFVKNGTAMDVSWYPDVSDILLITDYLITDYSSVAFDFALRLKPIILYMFDYCEYIKSSRGLMFDIKDCGLKTAFTKEELEDVVLNTSHTVFAELDLQSLAFFGTTETGKSANIICEVINDEYTKRFVTNDKLDK